VRFDIDEDEEIAWIPVVSRVISFSTKFELLTARDAGWDAHFQELYVAVSAISTALLAGLNVDPPLAVAPWAGGTKQTPLF